MRRPGIILAPIVAAAAVAALAACVAPDSKVGERHRWWAQLGPVLPHDTFPADCKLCHVGDGWNVLTADFRFDHEKETGVPLHGAHAQASCLRCHNDRGPVAVFAAKGCVGCHADVHQGDLGHDCTRCHGEENWQPKDAIALHERSRFPLTAAHAAVACHKCHPGAFVGNFLPTGPRCENCHLNQALGVTNPPHAGLGWVSDCQRCHPPSKWKLAVVR